MYELRQGAGGPRLCSRIACLRGLGVVKLGLVGEFRRGEADGLIERLPPQVEGVGGTEADPLVQDPFQKIYIRGKASSRRGGTAMCGKALNFFAAHK
jgi:hypothetical protein